MTIIVVSHAYPDFVKMPQSIRIELHKEANAYDEWSTKMNDVMAIIDAGVPNFK